MKLGIIGAGPGGYSAALRASDKKIKVKLFEKAEIGGICLNVGCIPTKALINCAKINNIILKSKRFGFNIKKSSINWNAMQRFMRSSTKRLTMGVSKLLKEKGVEIIEKNAVLLDDGTIEAGNKKYEFDRVIIATGSLPNPPPFTAPEDLWYSTEALNAKKIPETLTIIGGGVIGLEFAYIFSSLGSIVSVIEIEDEILPGEDRESSTLLRKELEKKGIRFNLSTRVSEITENHGYKIFFESNNRTEKIESERVLISVGRKPNIENLPDRIKIEHGAVKVNEFLQTTMEDVYAIGDCIGGHLLAHSAYKEAEIAVTHILGDKEMYKMENTPRVVYTNPEIASIGFNSEDLERNKIKYSVSRFPFSANGRAVASGDTVGQIKILHKDDGEILGCIIVGREASELITQLTIAMEHKLSTKELSRIVFPHPSLSEVIKEVTSIADGNPIH